MIRSALTHKPGEVWVPLLVAGSMAASLLVVPVAQAEEEAAGQPASSEAQGAGNPYPAPGAVPPPPGPYSEAPGGVPPQFRPDQELESAPAGYPGAEACSTGLPFMGRSHRSTPSAVMEAVRKRATPTRMVVSGSVPSTRMYACPACILLPMDFILSVPFAQ